MILIREIDYDTTEEPKIVFSRLTAGVERVHGLFGQVITNLTENTNLPWVGVYDEGKMNFGLIEPGYFFSLKFFQIIVRGQITESTHKTHVKIKLRLGWSTFLTFLMIYLATAVMTGIAFIYGDINDIAGLVLWILAFPVLWSILLNMKLDTIETRVEKLLGL